MLQRMRCPMGAAAMVQNWVGPLQQLLEGIRQRRSLRRAALAVLGLRLLTAACQSGGARHHGPAGDAAFVGILRASTIAPRARSALRRPAQHISKFHGVSWHEGRGQWQAHVANPVSGKPVSLGVYGSELDAAKAFDRAVLVLEQDKPANFPAGTYSEAELETEKVRLQDYWRQLPSSRYTGVYRTPANARWKAEIKLFGVKQFIDYFSDEAEAARAVDNAIRSTGVERAMRLQMLNFRCEEDFFDEDTWEQEPTPRGASSCFLGVIYHSASGQYLAKLGRKNLGLFDTELEAARAFDEASHAIAGPTNFRPPVDP